MNKYFLIFILIIISNLAMGQTNNYILLWKNVESLQEKNKTQDALVAINKIKEIAIIENNISEKIKAICYYQNVSKSIKEENLTETIAIFEKEIAKAKNVEKQVWHSFMADAYLNHYQNNRWQIIERTKLQIPSIDINQWCTQDYFDAIKSNYQASLQDEEALKKTPTSAYQSIIKQGNSKDDIYKTMYEVLLDKVLDFYKSDELELNKPTNAFRIDEKDGFGDANTFINSTLKTSDNNSSKYNVLKLYQALMKYYKSTNNINGLIDADLNRLEFVRLHTNTWQNNNQYINALNTIYKTYPTNVYAAKAKLKVADLIKDDVNEHNYFYNEDRNTSTNTKQNNRILAKQICEKIISDFKDSTIIKQANNILNTIVQDKIKLITEKTYLPNENCLANISYRNVSKIYCFIIPKKNIISDDEENYNDEELLKLCNKISPIIYNLLNSQDILNHSVDIKFPKLNIGKYFVVITNSSDLKNKKIIVTHNIISVTNIGYFKLNNQFLGNSKLVIVNRKTGAPIANATINIYHEDYNNTSNKYNLIKIKSLTTNSYGLSEMNNDNQMSKIEIIIGDDKFIPDEQHYFYKPERNTNTTAKKLVLFTDRNIYRPNQTIFFKGIYMQKNNLETTLLKNEKLEIEFADANGMKIKSKILTTNEYGSIADSFKIPEGLLSGSFSIRHSNGSVNVQIEEYKRPKFEVLIDTLKQAYHLNENILVTGNAKAYAGNSISNAKVSYKIVRNTRYIYDWCFWNDRFKTNNSTAEIAFGDAVTDNDGKFSFKFPALPNEETDKKTYPVFDYEISVDVVDINGETHNSKSIISIGYQSVQLITDVSTKEVAKNFKSINVSIKNFNNVFIPSNVIINCYQLKNIGTLKNNKLWDVPDQFIMTKSEFETNFPNDEYTNENDFTNWGIAKKIFSKNILSTEDGNVNIDKLPNEDAYYLLETETIDKSGDTLKQKNYVRIYKSETPSTLGNETIFKNLSEHNNEIYFGVPKQIQNIFLSQNIYNNEINYKWLQPNEINNSIAFALNNNDKFGREISYGYFYNNRFYSNTTNLVFIDTIKKININIATFRDKIAPGTGQKWIVNITGNDKEKVEAELLTSMYDASLDALHKADWENLEFNDNINLENSIEKSDEQITETEVEETFNYFEESIIDYNKLYNYYVVENNRYRRGKVMMMKSMGTTANDAAVDDKAEAKAYSPAKPQVKFTPPTIKKDEEDKADSYKWGEAEKPQAHQAPPPTIRKNFKETAFWFPQLHTDKDGNISFTFTTPDALTKWRWRMLAHTQDLKNAYLEKYVTTQKKVMVVTNNPRFFRNGDQAIYTGKVVNTSDKKISGNLQLQLFNAIDEKNIDALYNNMQNNLPFSLEAGESISLNFPITIPQNNTEPILAKIIASATSPDGSTFSDGEQNIIPVFENRMLVTDSKAFAVRGGQTKNLVLDNLINASATQQPFNYTIETTSNPTWYAVQSLPYLADFPYECAEQTFNRFYAFKISSFILNSNPLIASVLDKWRITDTSALYSNLEKNQELKTVLLQETPWLMQAKNETELKHHLAMLLDMKSSQAKSKLAYDKLVQMQTPEGGFTWFPGMRADRFITQYILTGFGKLTHLQVIKSNELQNLYPIVSTALAYTDREFLKHFIEMQKLMEKAKEKKQPFYFSENEIQYLYMRSFFLNIPYQNNEVKNAIQYYLNKLKTDAYKQSLPMQAMSAIALNKFGDVAEAKNILDGIKQNAITTDDDGMYWKDNTAGYYWHQAPIETQSLLIECFEEIAHDKNSVDEMKIWLLKNKQTNHWASTKATADAVYAMLLRGTNFLGSDGNLKISLGNKDINLNDYPAEAGTGYTKIKFAGNEIKKEMATVQVTNRNTNSPISWGAVYYQYFENLDKIKNANSDIAIEKNLFTVKNTATGEILNNLPSNGLSIGDKVRVRLVLTIKKSMDYVHLKDMRAACFEPLNVISSYKYEKGLGYYESTKDVATHFFFDHIEKGTYVFEYDLFATNKGTYSNGIAQMECMYAPEFAGHSNGVNVVVK